MRSRQIIKIFYFYLYSKCNQIKKQVTEKDSVEGKRLRSRLYSLLQKLGMAAILTLVVYELFFYLNLGRFLTFSELRASSFIQLEIVLSFLFIFSMLLAFSLISSFVRNTLQRFNPILRTVIEVFLIIGSSTLLLSLVSYGPIFLFTGVEASPNRLRTGYLVTAIFALFFYFFVERERSKKHLQAEMLRSAQLQKENFKAQLEGLKNQVSPHFLFNSLNVLVSLIPQDADRATEFTRRLSEIYRAFLHYSDQQLIALRKELEVAKAYIFLLETRFGESVKFELDIAPEALELQLPPGSLQVLLENAIKHNGSTRKKPLFIRITSLGSSIVVKNNLQPRLDQVDSTRKGLKNIQSRYSFLSNEKPEFNKTETEFIARLPLLKVESHENDYH